MDTPCDTPTRSSSESCLGRDSFDMISSIGENESVSDSASSSSTSLMSCVCDHEFAFGRRYHGYSRGRYPLPNDTLEQQREETCYAMMTRLTNGRLLFADIGEEPSKIVDVGTGIGTWAIDVADKYASAVVIGTDLSPIQPTWLPVNAQMFVEDCENDEWLHGSDVDLVRLGGMAGALRDLDSFLAKVYPHVKNGGYVEFHDMIPQIMCDDSTMEADDHLALFNEVTQQGCRSLGFQTIDAATVEDALDRAGLCNIQSVVKKVPIGRWPRDEGLRTIGILMQAVIGDMLGAMSLKPLIALGLSPKEREELLSTARESLKDDNAHRYVQCVFSWGQKGSLVSDTESYAESFADSYADSYGGESFASWSDVGAG